MIQIGSRIDKGSSRLTHLLSIDSNKSMRMDFRWGSVVGTFQHGWPKQGMKIDDVFADEVMHLMLAI